MAGIRSTETPHLSPSPMVLRTRMAGATPFNHDPNHLNIPEAVSPNGHQGHAYLGIASVAAQHRTTFAGWTVFHRSSASLGKNLLSPHGRYALARRLCRGGLLSCRHKAWGVARCSSSVKFLSTAHLLVVNLRSCQPEPKLFHDLQSSGPAVTRLLAKMLSLQTAALLLFPLVAASPVARAAETSVTVTVDTAPAGPTSSTYNWAEGWKANFPIHQSCNITLRTQLEAALAETMTIAAHARDHLLHNPKSELATKFFGNQSVAGPIGWYSKVVSTDKSEMLFRCDDPDRNCATQDGWAGHWRGSNATQETVICDLSYEIRRPLAALCGGGYTVAESKLNTYWATDLLHRAFHLPGISDGIIDHYAEDYAEALKLAATEPELSIIDSDTLQYFAIEAYAYDIAIPGVGCPGEKPIIDTTAGTSTAAPTTTTASDASGTTTANASCHTHDDGFVHCS